MSSLATGCPGAFSPSHQRAAFQKPSPPDLLLLMGHGMDKPSGSSLGTCKGSMGPKQGVDSATQPINTYLSAPNVCQGQCQPLGVWGLGRAARCVSACWAVPTTSSRGRLCGFPLSVSTALAPGAPH